MWVWSDDVADELVRRGRERSAGRIAGRQVAFRYEGPGLQALRTESLEILGEMLTR